LEYHFYDLKIVIAVVGKIHNMMKQLMIYTNMLVKGTPVNNTII